MAEVLQASAPTAIRIAPTGRLILAGWALVLLAAVAAALPGGGGLWFLAACVVAGLALVDGYLGRERMALWRVKAEGRARTGLGKPVRVRWLLERPAADAGGVVQIGIETPPTLDASRESSSFNLPSGGGTHFLEEELKPSERGTHAIGPIHLGIQSSLGFWDVRGRWETGATLRVHPDLLSDRKAFAVAFMPRLAGGVRLQRQLGRGREFEKLRDYLPGDGSDEIHWKATARRGKPVTKVFQVERTQEVYVLLDCGRLSGRRLPAKDGVEVPVLERQVSATLALAGLARRQGDRMGLVVFAEHVRRFVRAGSSNAHFAACREYLSEVRTERVSTDYRELFTSVAASLRRRALLVFMTDLSDEVSAEACARHLPLLTRRHLVLFVQPRAPQLAPVFQGPVPETEAGLGGVMAWHWEWENLRKVLASLEAAGARTALLDGPGYVGGVLNTYMNLRREQVL